MSAPPLRIVHLASLARSGETLVQRAFAAHPQVQVVFDLLEPNSPQQMKLFELLRVWPDATLPRWQFDGPIPPRTTVLLLKQGIFMPRHRAPGFGLLRNPYATFVSLWRYESRRLGEHGADASRNLELWRRFREPRLRVWAEAMQPALLPRLRAERDPVHQYLLFWAMRVRQIVAEQRTLLHYEDLVRSPEAQLRRVCAAVGLPWDAGLLHSHRRYRPGLVGHGGIDLGAPIRPVRDWTPDRQVPLQPFIDAVRASPLRRWDEIYVEQMEAVAC
jgi:Sulfotransferase family